MTTNLLDMACSLMEEAREKINEMTREEQERIGQVALKMIGDYPIYGSTSNISYSEAILIALVTDGEDFINNLNEEE